MNDFEIGSMGNFGGDAEMTFSPLPTRDAAPTPAVEIDLADKLPPQSAEKLQAILEEAETLHAGIAPKNERVKELREQVLKQQKRNNELVSRWGYKPNSDEMKAELEIEAKLREKLKAATAECEQRRALAYPAMRLSARCKQYVSSVRDPSKFIVAKGVTLPKISKAGDLIGFVDTKRDRIDALKIEQEVTKSAPIHSARAKQIHRAFVNSLAAEGVPDVVPCIEGARSPVLPKDYRRQGFNTPEAPTDVLAILFWACRDQIIAALDREVDDNADDASALTDEQRAERLAGIDRELFDLEQQEEAAITLGRSHFVNIPRREDIDPRIALGLDISSPAPSRED